MKKIFLITLSFICYNYTFSQEAWTLADCINHAIENNLEVKKKEVSVQQQELDLNTAQYSRLPNLNAGASQGFSFGRSLDETNAYVNRNTQTTGFDVSTNVPLFTGLQIPNTIAMNKFYVKAIKEELNQLKDNIGIEVTAAFLQALFNMEIYRVAIEQAALSQEQLARMESLYEVGKVAISNVYEAKAALAQDELSVIQADNNYNLSLLDLTQLLELPSPYGFTIVAPTEEPIFAELTIPENIYNEAVLFRPGILAAQYSLQGIEKGIAIAQSAFYPRLSFSAGLGSSYYNVSKINSPSFRNQLDNNFGKSLSFNLTIPIFNRFETRNRVKSARLQYFTQSLNLEENKKSLYKEIQQAYYNAVASENKYKASGIAVTANEAAFLLMKEKYENGKANSIEYNEMKMNLMKSISDRLQAKYEYLFRVKILDFYKGIPLAL